MFYETALSICATCAELWQAGDGERHGEAHDEGGAAGQQVHSVFPASPLMLLVSFGPTLSALCSEHFSTSHWIPLFLSGVRTGQRKLS